MKTQLISLNPIKDIIREQLIEKYNNTLYMNTSKVSVEVDIENLIQRYIESQEIALPEIYITNSAQLKLRTLVNKTESEIGWYGIVNTQPGLENVYVIEDIIVYPQIVTGATVEQDEDKMFEFEMGLTTDQVNHKRFHGHSHVNMSTGPSGVDESFYQDLLSQVNDYFIIMITNKKGETYTRFYDIKNNLYYIDIPIRVITDSGEIIDDWYDDVIGVVNKRTTTYRQTQSSIWDSDDWDYPLHSLSAPKKGHKKK